MSTAPANISELSSAEGLMFMTMRVDSQLFGVPVEKVRDVLNPQNITYIPLSTKDVAGSLNLRGRIVTVIDVRQRLGIAPRAANAEAMFVVVDHKGELYSLMVDSVGEVLTVPENTVEKTPAHVNGVWREVATGIHKLADELLVIIDVKTMLSL